MVMTLLLAADSNRPMITLSEAGKGSLHPWSLLTAAIPHLYGISRPLGDYWGPPSPDWGPVDLYLARNMATFYFGVLPVLGLLLFPFVLRFRPRFAGSPEAFAAGQDPHRRDALFLFGGFLALMLYSLGRYTPFFGIVFSLVPGIDKFRRPADALFVACALGSMAGGYAIHRWITAPTMRLPLWAIVLFLAAAVAAGTAGAFLAASVGRLTQATTPIAAAACFLAAGVVSLQLLRRIGARATLLPVVAGLVMLVDLGWNNAPNESTGLNPDSYAVLRPGTTNETITLLKRKVEETRGPDRIDRVELAGLGFHWPNATMIHGCTTRSATIPSVRRSTAPASARATISRVPTRGSFTPLMPSYRSLMADLVGLRYIASSVPLEELHRVASRAPGTPKVALQTADFPLIARTPDGYVYENPRALPRVLFPAEARQADFNELMKTGAWPEFDPTRTVLLARAVAPPAVRVDGERRTIRLVSYRNTEVIVEAESQTGGTSSSTIPGTIGGASRSTGRRPSWSGPTSPSGPCRCRPASMSSDLSSGPSAEPWRSFSEGVRVEDRTSCNGRPCNLRSPPMNRTSVLSPNLSRRISIRKPSVRSSGGIVVSQNRVASEAGARVLKAAVAMRSTPLSPPPSRSAWRSPG